MLGPPRSTAASSAPISASRVTASGGRLPSRDGRMWLPDRPGLGFTLSERMRCLTKETAEFGTR